MNFVNWQLELEIHNLLFSHPHFKIMRAQKVRFTGVPVEIAKSATLG